MVAVVVGWHFEGRRCHFVNRGAWLDLGRPGSQINLPANCGLPSRTRSRFADNNMEWFCPAKRAPGDCS